MTYDRDWNYSSALDDKQGRIRLFRVRTGPLRRLAVDADGTVDLTSMVGSQVPLTRAQIARILGTEGPKVQRLIEAGVIKHYSGGAGVRRNGAITYYLFDPGTTLRMLYEQWAATVREPVSNDDFKFAKLIQSGCKVPPMLPPQAVINGLAKKLGPKATVNRWDINAYVLVAYGMEKVFMAALRLAIGGLPPARAAQTPSAPISEDELATRVPFLRGARGTCFDPVFRGEFAAPDATSRGRLAKLDVMFDVSAVFAYSQAPLLRHPQLLPRYFRNIAKFEALAQNWDPAFDPQCAKSLKGALEHVAFGALECKFRPGVRFEIVRDTITILTRSRQKCEELGKAGLWKAAAVAPAPLLDRDNFITRLHETYGDHLKSHRDRRKKISHRISNSYARTIDGAAFRVAQIIEDGDATRAAIDHLLEPANGNLAYHDFEVEGLNLSTRGLPCGGDQIRYYRIWRYHAALLSVDLDRPPEDEPGPSCWTDATARMLPPSPTSKNSKTGARLKKGRSPKRFHGSDFIVEHLGTEAAPGSSQPVTAWHITLAEHHSLERPTFLDRDQLERRERLAASWRLPNFWSYQNGLLSFRAGRSRLAQLASRSDRRARRTFVPIEEFEHAIRMAGHGVDAVISTWCRRGEWMQQTVFADDWEPAPGSNSLGWRAIGKLAPGEPIPDPLPIFEVHDEHYDEAMNIADITRRRCHNGGDLPDVRAPDTIAWKCELQPYVFSFDSRFVDPRDLTYFLRVLFANIGDFRWHDLRHSVSNRARQAKAPLSVIRTGLRQRSRDLAGYYSELSQKQKHDRNRQILRKKRSRIARSQQKRRVA